MGGVQLKRLCLAVLLGVFGLSGALAAAEFKPGLLYNMGGKFDKSFNEAAYNGAEAFKGKTGIAYLEFEPQNDAQREQALRNMARRGATVIVAVSFAQTAAVETVAAELPDVKFTLVDGFVEAPNVQSIIFKEHEGFLSGRHGRRAGLQVRQAGLHRRHGHPLDPQVRLRLRAGRQARQGGRRGAGQHDGQHAGGLERPDQGRELARSQFGRGVDVVFAAAGGTGVGVYQAAVDSGMMAIGVDSNQNHLHPGTMLTSMVKRVDVAVDEAFRSAMEGTWEPGVKVLGLAEGGVGWALDEHNRSLISGDIEAKLDQARKDIIGGSIKVADYTANNSCDY